MLDGRICWTGGAELAAVTDVAGPLREPVLAGGITMPIEDKAFYANSLAGGASRGDDWKLRLVG